MDVSLTSSPNKSLVNEMSGNDSLLGLDDYASDAVLAAVELFDGYPDALLQFAAVCCAIFMLIGIPGNLITIIALARCKKVSNVFIYIINASAKAYSNHNNKLPLCFVDIPESDNISNKPIETDLLISSSNVVLNIFFLRKSKRVTK